MVLASRRFRKTADALLSDLTSVAFLNLWEVLHFDPVRDDLMIVVSPARNRSLSRSLKPTRTRDNYENDEARVAPFGCGCRGALVSIHFVQLRDDFVSAPLVHFPRSLCFGLPLTPSSLSLLPPNAAPIRSAPLVAAISRVGLLLIHFDHVCDDSERPILGSQRAPRTSKRSLRRCIAL